MKVHISEGNYTEAYKCCEYIRLKHSNSLSQSMRDSMKAMHMKYNLDQKFIKPYLKVAWSINLQNNHKKLFIITIGIQLLVWTISFREACCESSTSTPKCFWSCSPWCINFCFIQLTWNICLNFLFLISGWENEDFQPLPDNYCRMVDWILILNDLSGCSHALFWNSMLLFWHKPGLLDLCWVFISEDFLIVEPELSCSLSQKSSCAIWPYRAPSWIFAKSCLYIWYFWPIEHSFQTALWKISFNHDFQGQSDPCSSRNSTKFTNPQDCRSKQQPKPC